MKNGGVIVAENRLGTPGSGALLRMLKSSKLPIAQTRIEFSPRRMQCSHDADS